MIDSEFCRRCNRPYAMRKVGFCDSCIKDMSHEGNKMIDIARLHVGDKVRYQPSHYGNEKWENGIVKEIREGVTDSVWVVYNCPGNWDKYRDYTSAKTNLRDLKLGWKYQDNAT